MLEVAGGDRDAVATRQGRLAALGPGAIRPLDGRGVDGRGHQRRWTWRLSRAGTPSGAAVEASGVELSGRGRSDRVSAPSIRRPRGRSRCTATRRGGGALAAAPAETCSTSSSAPRVSACRRRYGGWRRTVDAPYGRRRQPRGGLPPSGSSVIRRRSRSRQGTTPVSSGTARRRRGILPQGASAPARPPVSGSDTRRDRAFGPTWNPQVSAPSVWPARVCSSHAVNASPA